MLVLLAVLRGGGRTADDFLSLAQSLQYCLLVSLIELIERHESDLILLLIVEAWDSRRLEVSRWELCERFVLEGHRELAVRVRRSWVQRWHLQEAIASAISKIGPLGLSLLCVL